jgi:two-component system sensor histidine kinase CpxA
VKPSNATTVAIPLYLKLLFWLALNLILIALLFAAFPGREGLGWHVLLTEPVRERLVAIGDDIGRELASVPQAQRAEVLARFAGMYGVGIEIGQRPPRPPSKAGPPPEPKQPPPAFGPGRDRPPPTDFGPGRRSEAQPPPREPPPGSPPGARQSAAPDRRLLAELVGVRHPDLFGAYFISIPSALPSADDPARRRPIELVVSAPSLPAFLGFLGVTDWVIFPALVILLSIALWVPFIWSITRSLGQVTRATEAIAEGRFDARVPQARRDELGRLARSVNQMAARLAGYIAAQKQFLADVAHEMTSPLARLQIALGVVEPQMPEKSRAAFRDVQEDVQMMAEMMNELLLFSRAGVQAERGPPGAVDVAAVIADVLERDDPAQRVRVDIPPATNARAHGSLLARALSNLVRNALRYAGERSGPIEVVAERAADEVRIAVRDRGPGVPEAALSKLGEPFFRPEASRSRDSGGFGLGLAIVRRCVEACGGEVAFRNRPGGGFEASIKLAAA